MNCNQAWRVTRVYELNAQEAVEMLAGELVPAPVTVLSSVVAITFIGRRKLPQN